MVVKWPDRQRSLLYLKLASLLSIQFIVIYGGANWLSGHRDDVHRLYFEWELAIPLVPSMIWVYFSITPLMLSPLFFLDINQLSRLAWQMAIAVFIAGAVFLMFPATTGYPSPEELSRAIEVLRSIDQPHNLVPSLHVALSAIIMSHLYQLFGLRGKLILATWLIALIVSVMLTHQHHLADVFGGLILAWACLRLLPDDRA